MKNIREINTRDIRRQVIRGTQHCSDCGATETSRLKNGNFYVHINPNAVEHWQNPQYNPYNKIIAISTLPNLDSRIARASTIVKEKGKFEGFVVPGLGDEGNIPLVNYYEASFEKKNPIDLAPKTIALANLSDIVLKENRIIFPDLCSDGNVIVDSKGEVYVVDPNSFQYENMYIGDGCSTVVAQFPQMEYFEGELPSKYLDGGVARTNQMMFTKQLDLASIIILYFKLVFHYDVEVILANAKSSEERERMIGQLFKIIGFENEYDLAQALLKLWQYNQPNNDISGIIRRLANEYSIFRRDSTAEELAFEFNKCMTTGIRMHRTKVIVKRK